MQIVLSLDTRLSLFYTNTMSLPTMQTTKMVTRSDTVTEGWSEDPSDERLSRKK